MSARITASAVALLLTAMGTVALAAGPAEWPWNDAATCVAYRTHKDMMFVKDVEVVGRNCSVAATVERDTATQGLRLSMTVPVKGFESGNWLRDRAVSEILGGEERAPVVFKSAWLDADQVRGLLAGSGTEVGGELVIRGTPQAVSMVVSAVPGSGGTVLRAQAATTFAQLGVTVPTAGPGGIFARPKPDVELLGQFLLVPQTLETSMLR